MKFEDLIPSPTRSPQHFLLRVTLLTILFLVILVACSGCTTKGPVNAAPVQSHCDTMCYTPCVKEDGDTGVRWVGDFTSPDAWETLGDDVVSSLSGKLRTCELHRKACAQCIQNLKDEGVIL